MTKMKNNGTKKSEGYLLWRIIFGIILLIFSLMSLLRFNATAALFYLMISIFIFIPGRFFKIHNKWIKVGIVIASVILVGLSNQLFNI